MASREDRAEKQRLELQALHSTIAQAVENITSGDEWKRVLQTAARFHNYSFNNQLLIAQQSDDQATQVASYTTWQTLGRQVRRGERGMRILAPIIRKVPFDKEGNQINDLNKAKETGTEITWKAKLVGSKPVSVFDISQTDGDELPTEAFGPKLIQGQAPDGLRETLETLVKDNDFSLEYVDPAVLGSANGVTDFGQNAIMIRNDMEPAQTVKTLIHEIAHMNLHADPAVRETAAFHRGTAEIEAESTAFLVGSVHGLDASDYTFPYVTGWSGGNPEKVKETASRVVAQAQKILAITRPVTSDEGIDELRKNAEHLQARQGEGVSMVSSRETPSGVDPRQKARELAAYCREESKKPLMQRMKDRPKFEERLIQLAPERQELVDKAKAVSAKPDPDMPYSIRYGLTGSRTSQVRSVPPTRIQPHHSPNRTEQRITR